MIRFAHAADLHWSEKLLLGDEIVIDRATGLNVRLSDVAKCMSSFCLQAREFGAQFSILAGDLYDRPKPSPNEERACIVSVDELAELGPVFIISGNHDYSGTALDATAVASLARRPNVFVSERPGFWDLQPSGPIWHAFGEALVEPPRWPEEQAPQARIFVLPWPSRSQLLADEANSAVTAGELNAMVSSRLAAIVAGMRALRIDGAPNILVFHGTICEAKINEQPAALQEDIGLSAADLYGFDYVALGHIHARQEITIPSWHGIAAFPGGIDRFAFGEEKEEKGANLVELGMRDQVWKPQITFARTPARVFRTHTIAEVMEHPIEDDGMTVHRVIGEVPKERLSEFHERLRLSSVRHLKLAIEVEKQGPRVRDSGMSELSPEAMVRRRLLARGVEESELASYLRLHAQISTGG